jgi:hypothetical protein
MTTARIRAKLDNPSPLYCHSENKLQTELKFLASYTVPRVDVLLSTVFQSLQGPILAANYNAPTRGGSAEPWPTAFGRGRQCQRPVDCSGTMFGERLNQLDLRVGKTVAFSGRRATFNVDIFNAMNASTVLSENSNFAGLADTNGPSDARFVRFGVQYDF